MQQCGVTNTNNNLLSGNFHISQDNRDGCSDLDNERKKKCREKNRSLEVFRFEETFERFPMI